ncbi:MAG TPA: PilT/PilU family type 4a pilus ATPase [Gammaproteobacteria bacterium]|nr:PilT/PilU family type 4a pilus ATPase [Gammaproteobacteria bacterium]
MDIKQLLIQLVEKGGSDLFVTADNPPCLKLNGVIDVLNQESISKETAREVVLSLMNEQQKTEYLQTKESNFAFDYAPYGRFRVSAFFHKNNCGMVIRRIQTKIPTIEMLGLPTILKTLIMQKRGLIIIVGGTGVGKSSTLAAMLGYRNQMAPGHIVSLEDPIEYLHTHDKCIITQREIGLDTASFDVALKNSMRQAPDVINIGEIRSPDNMQHALSFSETGHLCLSTLHANNASQALDRIIHFYPEFSHGQIFMDLSLNLRAIVAQQLIPTVTGEGRVPAVEILLNTPVMAAHIRTGDIHVLKEFMEKGVNQGMQTFDQSLFDLFKDGKISYEEALHHADSQNDLRLMIKLKTSYQIPSNVDIDKLDLLDNDEMRFDDPLNY